MSGNNMVRLPEVIVFAGPNGSGKSTITQMAKIGGEYINADDIKRTTLCTDLEAAVKAEELRKYMIEKILLLKQCCLPIGICSYCKKQKNYST